jgi:hypothetical protein
MLKAQLGECEQALVVPDRPRPMQSREHDLGILLERVLEPLTAEQLLGERAGRFPGQHALRKGSIEDLRILARHADRRGAGTGHEEQDDQGGIADQHECSRGQDGIENRPGPPWDLWPMIAHAGAAGPLASARGADGR